MKCSHGHPLNCQPPCGACVRGEPSGKEYVGYAKGGNARTPRFEVRSCRTGHLEEVHATIVNAIVAANIAQREDGCSYCIVDTELPRLALDGTLDDRIVWRQGEPSDAARKWWLEQVWRESLEALRRTVST